MPSNHDLETPLSRHRETQAADREATAVRIVNYPRFILFALTCYVAMQFFDTIARALLLFFGAFLIAIVLNLPVRWLENKGVSRGISVAGVALLFLGGLVAAGMFAVPFIADQAVSLAAQSPERLERLQEQMNRFTRDYPALRGIVREDQLSIAHLSGYAQALLPRLGRYTLGFFGALATGFFMLVIALYVLASPRPLVRGFLSAVPPAYRTAATRAMTRIVGQLESWVMATLLLMLIVGVLSGIGLWIVGVPNPLLFALIAGFGEAIPTIGPILSAVPPAIVALSDSPMRALWVGVVFLVVQQVENNLLVPMIMARNLKLHPVSVLFFVLALGAFLGVVGALLAVPVTIIVKVIFEEFYEKRRAPRSSALDEAADKVLRAGARPGRDSAPRPEQIQEEGE